MIHSSDNKINILLVDDNPANLIALAAVLDNPEYQLILAHSGREALEYLDDGEFAAVLLDVQMPEMDGFETARRIRASPGSKTTPIIFVTAIYRETKFVHDGYAAGGVDYLFKPLDPDIVKSKVAIFVDLYLKNKKLLFEQERTGRLVDIQRITTDALAAASSIDQAIPEILKEICKTLRWDMGTYWDVTPTSNTLSCKYFWSAPSCPASFISGAVKETFAPGIGLPGRVWMGSRGMWAREGLGSAVGFPIEVSGDIAGVIEFFSREPQMEDLELLKILTAVGNQIGQFIGRMGALQVAQESLRARDEFMSIASHELRTPLTVLRLQSRFSRGRLEKGDPEFFKKETLSKSFDITVNQVERMIHLVESMLDVSRIESGKLLMTPEQLDLGELVQRATDGFVDQLEEKGSRLILNIAPGIVGEWDRFRLEQVVTNLVANAMKYGDGNSIEVSVDSDTRMARVSVRDHGPGIASDDLERIFGRYERASGRNNSAGLGLGLYISRQIVQAHDGDIRVNSQPGKGSIFTVELPLESSRAIVMQY